MEIIKSNTIKRREEDKKRIEIRLYDNMCSRVYSHQGFAKSENSVIQENNSQLGLYAVNVDFPLPFVVDAYLFKKDIYPKQIHKIHC